jgi:hypothetical protein
MMLSVPPYVLLEWSGMRMVEGVCSKDAMYEL